MNRKHQDTFLREGAEQITELNNALLALEEHPDDEEVMDQCFRGAHTLKGNFAAQGYGEASELAHAVEDLLEEIREGRRSVETGLMDQLFVGVDALDDLLEDIEADEEPRAVDDLIAHLREWRVDPEDDGAAPGEPTEGLAESPDPDDAESRTASRPGDAESGTASRPGDADAAGSQALATLSAAIETGSIVRASVELADSEVPGAAGMLVLERLADRFDVVETNPPTDVVHDGDHDGHVDVFVEGADQTALREAVLALQPVESASVTSIAGVDFDSDLPEPDDWAQTDAPKPPDESDGDRQTADGSDTSVADHDGNDTDAERPDEESAGVVDRLWSRLTAVGGLFAVRRRRGTGGPDGDEGAEATSSDGGATVDTLPSSVSDWGAAGTVGAAAGPATGAPDDGTTGAPDDGTTGAPAESAGPSGPDPTISVDDVSTVRVDVEQLDELYGMVERLVTSRIKLRSTFEEAGIEPGRDLDELDKTTNSLQDTVMDMRLVPMNTVVEKFPRIVRDLAREQGKEVAIELSGTDVELDRRILDRISDPLVHLVRNAVDHGIESPDDRENADKPREGRVELTARRERDTVVVTIADDGRGIDPETVREAALEKGIRTERELDAMDDSSVYDLVFHPGFSTSAEVTEVSGRGVGMDVVHNTVTRLDGSVSVDSTPGAGTEVTLRLPVSVAIVKVLFVRVDGDRFGVPIKKIDRVTHFEGAETVNGTEVVESDAGLRPVVRLDEALDTVPAGSTNGDGMLVRIRASERPIALHCDEIADYEEVVVKPLDGVLSGTPGLSGTAVLGEGEIVPVLDVTTI